MDEMLRISGLTVRFETYEGSVMALDRLDLAIGRGETLGLVGETGCGKTITALSILRLIPQPGEIECGSIMFNVDGGKDPVDLLKLSEEEMRRIRGSRIAMIFQEPSAALNPVYTIGDQIAEAILVHRRQEVGLEALRSVRRLLDSDRMSRSSLLRPVWELEEKLYLEMARNPESPFLKIAGRIPLFKRVLWRMRVEAEEMVIKILREVEIPDAERVARQFPHQLSGGMKQRSVIAMGLSCHPRFLIADEPTTALDVTIQAQILELLRRLKVERDSSILYITHDLAVAAEVCDRIGVMYSGSLCELARSTDLFAAPQHPYTRALQAAVPRPGEEPQSIRGLIPDPLNLPSGCRFHPRCDSASEICGKTVPAMREVAPGHLVACHIMQGASCGSSG